MSWRLLVRSAAAALSALVLLAAVPAAIAQRLPTNVLVRGAAMRALERLYEPGVEIVTQGSWNAASGYNDPRFQQMIGGASDHDMRVFMPSPAGQTPAEAAAFRERATRVWQRYRNLVDEELNRLVQVGVLRADELNVVRRSINVYPPEQLMAGVNNSEDALALFNRLRTYPNLIDTSAENARGAYGALVKFERQEFETGARVRVLTQANGRARFTSLSDLNHMTEGYGLRKPLGVAVSATNNLDDALHAIEANARNLKDVAKYTERAHKRLVEARNKLRIAQPASDELGALRAKLAEKRAAFEAAEPQAGIAEALTGNRVPRARTAEEIATQNRLLAETQAMNDEIRRVLRIATEESLILQNMARAIQEGQPVVARFYRLLMSGGGKWVGTLATMRDSMRSINERAKQIGYLNVVSALYEFYSFPWNYENEGTTMASARLAKGLATLAVPELAIGELIGLVATTVAEYAVDHVKAYGYSAVASRQDCLDLLAGHYSVYGREVQVLGVGTKACHASPSLRQLACDVYDSGDLRGTIARGGRPDARSIPSQLRGMIDCHAENASYRSDETRTSDKGVQDFIVNRCTQDVLPKWLQERDIVLEEIAQAAGAIDGGSLFASFDPEQAVIRDPAKGTTVTVTAEIAPEYQDAIDLMKSGLQCAGSKVAKPFVYERVVWRQDGKEVDSGTRLGARQFTFARASSSTVCVDWELEYGVIGAPTVLTPAEMAGKIRKTACTTIDAMVDVGVEKITAKITGPKKAAPPEKAETGKALSFAVDLATKRDPKEFRYAWSFPDGNVQTQGDVPEPKVIWYRPGRYEVSLEVYEASDSWTVSQIKPKPLAQAKHTVTVESSLADARNDGKVTIAVTGPAEIRVGGSADLSATVQAPEHLKAKIRQVYWYLWRMGGPDEDPSEIGFQGYELLGTGPTLRYTPARAGDVTILARVMGESIAGEVAGTSHRLHVSCRDEGGRSVCEGPKPAPQKLGVIVLPDRRNVATGDQVLVNAIASGGKPPFTFAWSPAVDGDGPAVTYRPTAAAPTLTVTTTDATGASAKESVTFGVDRALPLLEGLAATETFGTSRQLSAALEGGRSLQWQSSPALAFDKPDSADGRGWVIFNRLGRVKVWADVMVPKDGTLSKLGSTDQVEVEVVAPGSRIAFEPAASKPGGEVTARVEFAPPPGPALVYYVWTQPATAQREEVAPGTIRFKAGDKPTAIDVEVRAKASDQTVAQLSARFDPTGAATSDGAVSGQAGGPSKAKQAAELLAKAKVAVAAGQLDEGIAGAADAAKTDPSLAEAATLGAQWQTERQNVTRQIAASDAALSAGRIADAKKQLAVAQAVHPKYRPVVDAAQRVAQREAERARQVQSLIGAAQAALARGDVDAAATSAAQAAQLDPAASAQIVNQVSYDAKKQGWAAVNDRDFARAIPRLELATRFAPADTDARDRLAQAKRFAATWPQVQAKARELDALVAALKPFSAYEVLLQMQNLQFEMPSAMGNPLSRRAMEASNRALAEYNVFWQAKTDEHRRTFVEQDWDAMLKNARETLTRELAPASVNEARSRLAFAEQQLAGQKEALDYAAQIRSTLAAGRLGDPQVVLGELRTRAGRFKPQDARGQPVRDTISALEHHQRVVAAKGYAAVAFASGERMLAAYDYASAAREFAAGLKALRENGDPADPDIAKYERKRQDAEARAQRIATLMPRIASIAMDPAPAAKATLEQAFGEADEVVRLQPTNTDAQIYRNRIADKLKQLDAQAQARAAAAALWNEGRRLYEGGDALAALAKFRESVRAWPDDANQRYVADLEARIAQARAAAAALWNEGRALYDAGRPRDALAKFRDSLRAWPDASNARYVEQLEAALAAQAAAPRPVAPAPAPPVAPPPVAMPPVAMPPPPAPPIASPAGASPPTVSGSPATPAAGVNADAGFYLVDLTPVGGKKSPARTVKGLRVDDGSWVRLKATHEKRLVLDVPIAQRVGASAIAVVSNLDNAHFLKDGFLTTTLTVHTTAGDRTYEFRAGVHSSEWNRGETGGAEHAYPKATAIGDARWMAVFPLPPGSVVTGLRFDHRDTDPKLYHMGAAPGFCLRGITLVTGASLPAEAAAAAAASAAGSAPGGSGPVAPAPVAPTPATQPASPPGPAASGLLAHYPLDGNAQDASGRGRHGKVVGAQPTADRFGRAGGALLFDGHSHVELPLDVNPSVVPKLTFTAWVRSDAPAPIQQLMSHDDSGYDRSVGIDGRGGGVGWSMFAGSGAVVGFRPVQKGQWVFVSAVWDQPAGTVRLQVDDWVVERPGSLGGGATTLNLGRNPGFGEYFVGAIDDVRLYGEALGASQVAQVRSGGSPSAAAPAAPSPANPGARGNVVFDNGNIGGVGNAPTRPTTFTLAEPRTIAMIRNYHWNNGRGAAPGSIGLRDAAGRTYGPWPVVATPGQGGAPNVYWTARPNAALPPGTYTVIDSDPATWSQNGESGGAGHVRVEAAP